MRAAAQITLSCGAGMAAPATSLLPVSAGRRAVITGSASSALRSPPVTVQRMIRRPAFLCIVTLGMNVLNCR